MLAAVETTFIMGFAELGLVVGFWKKRRYTSMVGHRFDYFAGHAGGVLISMERKANRERAILAFGIFALFSILCR
jgi:hypothetical protein